MARAQPADSADEAAAATAGIAQELLARVLEAAP